LTSKVLFDIISFNKLAIKMSSESSNQSETSTEKQSDLLEIRTVGPNTISAISIMGENEVLAGNVLRRLCKLGDHVARTEMDPRPDDKKNPCEAGCIIHRQIIERAQKNWEQRCADENLVQVIFELGTKPENVFMVSVTADSVGFADEVDQKPDEYPYKVNAATNIKELPGFNAFFVREGDRINGDEVVALGRRLADCGDINLEFADKDGKKVMGFMHMTKGNLHGEGHLQFVHDGARVGSFEYFLRTGLDHYGADISSVNIRVAAAIKPEHYDYTFRDEEHIQKEFPGWLTMLDEQGRSLLINTARPKWHMGEQFDPDDGWKVNFQAMLRWQITKVQDLKSQQVNWEGFIDAGDEDSQHASNHRGYSNPIWNGRDAYFTAWKDKLTR